MDHNSDRDEYDDNSISLISDLVDQTVRTTVITRANRLQSCFYAKDIISKKFKIGTPIPFVLFVKDTALSIFLHILGFPIHFTQAFQNSRTPNFLDPTLVESQSF